MHLSALFTWYFSVCFLCFLFYCLLSMSVITFRVSRRPREMYCGHAHLCVCLCVCLSAAACPHYCTDQDVTWGSGRGCPLVVHFGRLCNRCTGCVAMATLLKCVAEPSGNPPGPPHAARMPHTHTNYACRRRPLAGDNIDAPAACTVPFRLYCGGVVIRTRNVS